MPVKETGMDAKELAKAVAELVTMDELAQVLRCTRETLKTWQRQGRLVPTRIGGRLYITADEMRDIMKHGLPPASEAYRQKVRDYYARKRSAAARAAAKGGK